MEQWWLRPSRGWDGASHLPLGLTCHLLLDHRCHIISQFNQGLYDCVIATDAEVLGPPVKGKGKQRGKGPKGERQVHVSLLPVLLRETCLSAFQKTLKLGCRGGKLGPQSLPCPRGPWPPWSGEGE